MTPQLKLYLENHRAYIKDEQFDSLYNLCPLNCKKELAMFLLECSDNDTSLIPQTTSTVLLEEQVHKYLPNVTIVYSWILYDKHFSTESGMKVRPGKIQYVAVYDGKVIDGTSSWESSEDFVNTVVVAKCAAKNLAMDIKEKSND